MSDELDRLAAEQGVKPIESAAELRTDDPMTDEEWGRYRAAMLYGDHRDARGLKILADARGVSLEELYELAEKGLLGKEIDGGA